MRLFGLSFSSPLHAPAGLHLPLDEVLIHSLGGASAVTDAEPAGVLMVVAADKLGHFELAVAVADEGFGSAAHVVVFYSAGGKMARGNG